MDHHSFDSEVIESLNHLIPPVRKDLQNANIDFSRNHLQVLRAFSHKFANKCSKSCIKTRHADSSTSLILKKTSDRQILQHYSVASYTNFHCNQKYSQQNNTKHIEKEKPLIKVTVIPRSNQNQAAKLLRKRRVVTKSIQSTSSNHENSIQTKNVFLVVAGRKKDKVYEIKTTGSAGLAEELIKEDDVNLCNFKQFIKTLNMERKKRKEKNKEDKMKETQVVYDTPTVKHVCRCSKATEETQDVAGKSRVRIFGRIGVTEGDKYVLKCQATVDDKPVQVPTSLSTAEKQLSSSSLADYGNGSASPNVIACVREIPDSDYRDSIMQTDFRVNAVNDLLMNIDYRNNTSKESQSTQVNFNKPNNRSAFPKSEQITRCNCGTSADYPNYPIKKDSNDYEGNHNLKACQSPLVIISVFPKQDNLAEIVKTVQCAQIDTRRATIPGILKKLQDKINNEESKPKTSIIKTIRSRSPSPKGLKAKSKDKKVTEIRNVKTVIRNESPLRSKIPKKEPKKGITSSKPTMQIFHSNKKESINKTPNTSPIRSPRSKSPSPITKKGPQKTINIPRQSFKNKPQSPVTKQDKGINTEHMKTKKALVESYTEKIYEKMSSDKDKPLVTDLSKVSVNIDSENEYYDVSFRRDRYTTDLNVRKTMKEAGAQKSLDENKKLGPMEHYYTPNKSKKQRKSSLCQSICENLSNEELALVNKASRLTTRDSLEISHRREDKTIKKTQTQPLDDQLTTNSDDMKFLAPIKHYTGDKCSICDPVERDREIRELLGVEGRRINSQSKDPQSHVFDTAYQTSRHCFYPNQCDNTFVAGLALNHFNSCACTNDMSEQSGIKLTKSFIKNKTKSMSNKKNSTEDPKPTNQNDKQRQSNQKTEHETQCACTGVMSDHSINKLTRTYDDNKTESKSYKKYSAEDPKQTNQNEKLRQNEPKTNDPKHETQCACTDVMSDQSINKITKTYNGVKTESKSHKKYFSEDPQPNKQNEKPRQSKQKSDDPKYETQCSCTDVMSDQSVNKLNKYQKENIKESKSPMKYFSRIPKPTNKNERQSKKKPDDPKHKNQCACTDATSDQFVSNNKLTKSNEKTKSKLNKKKSAGVLKPTNQSEKQRQSKQKTDGILPTSSTPQGKNVEARTSIYQQMTLNHNVQVFLQVEQFSKQKPIVLSRKQYQKVKRTIQKTITKDKSKRCMCNHSIVSVGEVREKPQKSVLAYFNREVQTEFWSPKDETIKDKLSKSRKQNEVETVVLYSNYARGSSVKNRKPQKSSARQAVSSMEVKYASVAFLKHVTFSSTNMGSVGSSSYARRNQLSIETLFKGHRKSHTPNLGTSAFSLLSEADISEPKSMIDAKNKKPFLKRLMSCLVMRSKTSERKELRVSLPSTENSSVDSYHISTSLAGLDMSSSIYDTSVSFYSDHSIHPLSNKLKRGFFSSVRGFLTSRKS